MNDRTGNDYETLLLTQARHLQIWEERSRPKLFSQVREYVLSMNEQARTVNDKHRVFRGQDIVALLMAWPDIENAGFPPLPKPAQPGEEYI